MEPRHRTGVGPDARVAESAVGEGFAAALRAGLGRATVNGLRAEGRPAGPPPPPAEERAADARREERRGAAREAGDGIGAPIGPALGRLRLPEAAAGDPGGHPALAHEALARAERHLARLSGGLRAPGEVPPLKDAVLDFAVQAAPAGLTLSVRSAGRERELPDAWRREVLLAVRACLRDSFRRAPAGRVGVVSRVTRLWMYVRVEDDGRSPATATVPVPANANANSCGCGCGLPPGPGEGEGLRSAAGRIEALGGRLAVRGAPGAGTRVEMHVPLRSFP